MLSNDYFISFYANNGLTRGIPSFTISYELYLEKLSSYTFKRGLHDVSRLRIILYFVRGNEQIERDTT